MSANWSMRSYGRPYFLACQRDLAGMDAAGLGAYGVVDMGIEFRIFKLPEQHASPSELHPAFALAEFLPGKTIFALGFTPDGRYGATVGLEMGGPLFLSRAGAVSADGLWHTLYAFFDFGTGDLSVSFDGGPNDSVSSIYTKPAVPVSLGLMMLFNGPSGISRTDLAIRNANFGCQGVSGSSGVVDYFVKEKSGAILNGDRRTAGTYPFGNDFDLEVGYRPPLGYALPWGGIPTDTPGSEAYGWRVETAHTEVTPTPTRHTEVALT